jgi:hypothetical protein
MSKRRQKIPRCQGRFRGNDVRSRPKLGRTCVSTLLLTLGGFQGSISTNGLLAGHTGQSGPSSDRSKDYSSGSSNTGVRLELSVAAVYRVSVKLTGSLKLQRDKMKQYQKRVCHMCFNGICILI